MFILNVGHHLKCHPHSEINVGVLCPPTGNALGILAGSPVIYCLIDDLVAGPTIYKCVDDTALSESSSSTSQT